MISASGGTSVAQNWYALRAVGESANRCLRDAEAADAQPAPDVASFCRVTHPSTTAEGLYAAGLRFGEARVMAVLAALVGFRHLVAGFRNRQMVERVRALGAAPGRGERLALLRSTPIPMAFRRADLVSSTQRSLRVSHMGFVKPPGYDASAYSKNTRPARSTMQGTFNWL